DAQRLVMHVTLDPGARLEQHADAADRSHDRAEDGYRLGRDDAGDLTDIADDDFSAEHVTLDLALDADLALRDDAQALANDRQIPTDDGNAAAGAVVGRPRRNDGLRMDLVMQRRRRLAR